MELGTVTGQPDAQWFHLVTLTYIRAEQDRIHEVIDGWEAIVAGRRLQAAPGLYAWVCSETGNLNEARRQMGAFAPPDFSDVPLNIGGDFARFRDNPTRRALYPTLRPDFRRWAFYAVWEGEAVLDEFLEHSPVGHSWAAGAAHAWHLWLRPLRVRGPWQGMQLLQDVTDGRAADGPVAQLVRLDLTLRGTLAMWGWAAPNLLGHVPGDDELLIAIPLVDRPYAQPVSFSIWRSAESAAAFAYRSDGHREAVARVAKSQTSLLDRHSSGRFLPYRSQGRWQGRNPLERTLPAR